MSAVDGCEPQFTDLGNAERLTAEHGHRLRYIHEEQRWLVWDGRRWCRDSTGEVDRAAKGIARDMLRAAAGIADDERRKETAKFALKSQGEPRIRAMIALARSEPVFAVSAQQLDAHPFLLTVGNGTLDLRSGRLRESRPDDLLTRGTDVEYDVSAECDRWKRFLLEVFGGDVELVAFVQRLIGYVLTGDVREQVLVVFYGTGANGKTTLIETVKRLLGDLAVTAAFGTFTQSRNDRGPRNDLARLHGARLVVASEGNQAEQLDEATVKEITGGDTITARFLYGEHFEYQPAFKLALVSNFKPSVAGDDPAIWRRMRLLPFAESFEGREDKGLVDALAKELPGILAWAVEGCLEWQRVGLTPPAAVIQATAAYRAEEDTLGAFLDECCELGDDLETAARLLRAAYGTWCEASGADALSAGELGKALQRRGITARRGSKGVRFYSGLRVTGDGCDGVSVKPSIPARMKGVRKPPSPPSPVTQGRAA